MSFYEEDLDPHGECAAEIHRLQFEVERLRRVLQKITEIREGEICQSVARDALNP